MKVTAHDAHAPVSRSSESSEWWGRERFFSESIQDERRPCPEVIDLTGQRRYLVQGPFVALKAGLWRVTAVLEVCPEAARRPIAVEFGAEPDYTIAYVPARCPGRHEIDVDHVMKHGDLAQVRIYLVRAAFHGEFRFFGAHARYLGDAGAD